ncbi:helix-turn-helix transcriptional regulator [Companilactobacillus kimchiensis]|uniref:Transcriptional regulator n=1 Tax=Companilactobacillus kimchiensis TaxID=993692 RepID=A0A0R2LFZ6_9LACO|nr:helix-turn-helix transcriptional regulator [Companilactobacillus kimchiensis]KRO00750.1 transcriptional regulator [Companilactobacillus kimchiensis]
MKLHEQIKKYRKQKHFSQEELADKVYVSRQTISNWENNRSYPTLDSLLIMSALFDISLDTLVKGDIDLMRQELSKHDMSFWTKVMLAFIFLGIIVGIPATALLHDGFIVPILLWGIGMFAAIKIDLIKKKYNLKTYQEILAFDEGREVSSEFKKKSRQNYWKREFLMIIISIVIILLLSGFVLLVLKVWR